MKAPLRTNPRSARSAARGVCPLCERAFPKARLHAALKNVSVPSQQAVVQAIRGKFPAWSPDEGVCNQCWKAFQGVAQVAEFLKTHKLLVLLFLTLVSPLLLTGCGRSAASPPQKLAVQTALARSMADFKPETEPGYIGIVRAENETDLGFKVGGIVELIGPAPGRDWDEGTRVRRGALIARLKQADFVNALDSAEAHADLAGKVRQRVRQLRAGDAISQQELDVSEANWLMARAQLEQARQNTNDSQLCAPGDGTVLVRYVNSGVTVGAGQRVLRFADTSTMSVELGVPDRMVNHFAPGKEFPVEVAALEGRPAFRGKVSEVGVLASLDTRLFRVVIKVPNPDGAIRSGMTATVRVGDPVRFRPEAVQIPLSALVTFSPATGSAGEAGSRLAVFTVKDSRAVRRPVKTGDILGSSIVVNEGIAAGDEVVTAGASFLYDGAPIDVLSNLPPVD